MTEQTRHLEEQNRWALELDEKLESGAGSASLQLQDEFEAEQAAGAEMACGIRTGRWRIFGDEISRRDRMGARNRAALIGQLAKKCVELAETVRLLDTAEATVVERTRWAQELHQRLETIEAQFRMMRESRWLKLGRAVGWVRGWKVDAQRLLGGLWRILRGLPLALLSPVLLFVAALDAAD